MNSHSHEIRGFCHNKGGFHLCTNQKGGEWKTAKNPEH